MDDPFSSGLFIMPAFAYTYLCITVVKAIYSKRACDMEANCYTTKQKTLLLPIFFLANLLIYLKFMKILKKVTNLPNFSILDTKLFCNDV